MQRIEAFPLLVESVHRALGAALVIASGVLLAMQATVRALEAGRGEREI